MSVVCIGGASIDRKYSAIADLQYGTSNPVRTRRNFGGVARNVAENLARLGADVSLLSVTGNDENAAAMIDHAQRCGIRTDLMLRDAAHVTPEYAAVVTAAGELIVGLADMSAVETLSVSGLESRWEQLSQAEWLFADCNLPADVLSWIVDRANREGVRLAIDAVSEPKVRKLPGDLTGVDLIVLNEGEAAAYLGEDGDAFAALPMAERAGRVLARGVRNAVLTMGERGVVAACGGQVQHIRAVATHTVDTTGGSDALCAGVIFGLTRGRTLHEAAGIGSVAAALTVESPSTVRPDLSLSLLDLHAKRLDEACTLL